MSIDQNDDNIDDTDAADADYSMPDPFSLAIELCRIAAKPATYAAAVKKLRKVGRDIAAAEQKLAALTTEAEQKQAAFAEREAAIDGRERAITAREDAFAASIEEARDNLRRYYDSIAEADRHVRYRVLSHAGLLSGYNLELQDLPSWGQLKRLVVGLPDDPPPIERDVAAPLRIDALSDTSDDPHADRHGAPFVGSTLTRDVAHHKRKSAA
jgi:hypothetical protein